MKAFAAAAVAGCLIFASGVAQAADPKLDNALKTVTALGNDPAKLKIYCDMNAAMAGADNQTDATKSADVDKKVDESIKALGPDFEALWNLGEQLDPESTDGKALGDAMDALDAKCPK